MMFLTFSRKMLILACFYLNMCINCKYNISLRVDFYYRLAFLLNLRNPVNMLVKILDAHFYFSVGFSPVLFFQAVAETPLKSLSTLYIQCVSHSFSYCSILVSCFNLSRYHVSTSSSMSPNQSANILSSLYLIWSCVLFMKCILSILGHGWWVCTVSCVKPRLFLPHEMFSLLKNRSKMSFATEVFLYNDNSRSNLYSTLYNTRIF